MRVVHAGFKKMLCAWKRLRILRRYSSATGRGSHKHRVTCTSLFLPRAQPDSQQASIKSHKVFTIHYTMKS